MKSVKEQLLKDLDTIFQSIVKANIREGRKMTRRQICDIIASTPAPRLYILPEYALRVLRSNPGCGARSYHSSAMQQELRFRYLALPENMRTLPNITEIIMQPAPSFYISSSRIYDLLYKVYNRRK